MPSQDSAGGGISFFQALFHLGQGLYARRIAQPAGIGESTNDGQLPSCLTQPFVSFRLIIDIFNAAPI